MSHTYSACMVSALITLRKLEGGKYLGKAGDGISSYVPRNIRIYADTEVTVPLTVPISFHFNCENLLHTLTKCGLTLNLFLIFSKRHLSAVLYFRGVTRGRQRQMTLQKLSDLQKHANAESTQHVLFSEIEASASKLLANMPFSCLSSFTTGS